VVQSQVYRQAMDKKSEYEPQTPQQQPRKSTTDNLYDSNYSKFVKTDIKAYLDRGHNNNWKSCVKNIKEKKKLLQYKYNPIMKSNYAEYYVNKGEAAKQSPWNLDQEKRKLKVEYHAPGTFKSSYNS
jgi:hypothetical protein